MKESAAKKQVKEHNDGSCLCGMVHSSPRCYFAMGYMKGLEAGRKKKKGR